MISLIRTVLKKFYNYIVIRNNCRGFFFDLRGKVGVRGNARKRRVFISLGENNYTTKNLRFYYDFRIVRTGTGCMGMHTMITY